MFVDPDVVLMLEHNVSNEKSNGWRPDIALGMTNFFSDPTYSHVWNLNRWWAELFENDILGFQIHVLLFIWLACLAQYWLLRKIVPDGDQMVAVILSGLLAYGSLRYEFLFSSTNTGQLIFTPFVSVVLYNFLDRPLLRHYFYYTLLLGAIAFTGSSTSLLAFLCYLGVFCTGIAVYKGWHNDLRQLGVALRRFFILNIASGVSIGLMAGWGFYSLMLEQLTFGYVRDPDYTTDYFFHSLSLMGLIKHLSLYFHAGLFSPWSGQLGIDQKLGLHSWNHLSPLTPILVLIVIFFKSRNFWEFIAKFMVLATYAYHEVLYFFPGLFNLVQSVVHLYPQNKLHPYIQMYQIVLIAMIMQRLKTSEEGESFSAPWLPRVVAFGLSFLYAGLFLVAAGAWVAPGVLADVLALSLSNVVSPNSTTEAFLLFLVKGNVQLFHETMGWASVFFYGFTFVMMMIFASRRWPDFVTMRGGWIFAMALFLNSLLLSWAVYPLNNEPLVWDQQRVDGAPLAEKFAPTDRLARVGLSACKGRSDYQECIRNKFFDEEYGFRRYQVGYRWMPPLEFTKTKSFTPRPSAEYIKTFMTLENSNARGILRTLQMESPIFASRIYDISAVNYLLSQNRLPDAENLELVHKNKQFYLYRNHRAWPYFYFADRFETIDAYEDLYDAEQGVAYLWEGDARISLSPKLPDGDRKVELVKFEYGDVEFKYSSDVQEFLVMADSWHPNWRANVNGKDIPIVKTNGVFKGVLLPPGAGTVHFYFDNTSYLPGIWISIVSWVLFFFGWSWCVLRLREKY